MLMGIARLLQGLGWLLVGISELGNFVLALIAFYGWGPEKQIQERPLLEILRDWEKGELFSEDERQRTTPKRDLNSAARPDEGY